MTIQTIERLVAELLATPAHPLNGEQKQVVYDFAAGLFAGRVGDMRCSSDLTLAQVQSLRALSHKQTFYIDYFATHHGASDAKLLGILPGADSKTIRAHLFDIPAMTAKITPEIRKEIACRSIDWAKATLIDQLAHSAGTDSSFVTPARQTVNYNPSLLLAKAEAVRAYRVFFRQVEQHIGSEPDALIAEAERAVLALYVGRLHAMAAVDVFPGLLSLEDQLKHSPATPQSAIWHSDLVRVAPFIGVISTMDTEQRVRARDTYARHLDAIRQGAPFELDTVDEQESTLFAARVLDQLVLSLESLGAPVLLQKTTLGERLERTTWGAKDIKQFLEAILSDWGMLSQYPATWDSVDDRDGFAADEKFQVVITPHRKNMTVDSTRRVVNIPVDIVRPLAGLYPAGALSLIAHELTHVLQAYSDYELGQHIPLAKIKGRRYRILREAGGVYQEYVLNRDYFGLSREPNLHYVRAYQAKLAGENRVTVARAFYDSLRSGKQPDPAEDLTLRQLAVNRTARLYRHGGHSSQVLDYVEQSVVCAVLGERMEPEQVNTFLLGGASFSLEDSAVLHRYGLFALQKTAPYNPAETVMRMFLSE